MNQIIFNLKSFCSLFAPFNPSNKYNPSDSKRGNSGRGSGGGGNGGLFRGGGNVRPRGGFMTTSDLRSAPMPGCSSCG